MITFHTLKWKNFLSTGNCTTEIRLDSHKKTVFLGESGSGKSTILDAVTFVLYNKPFRDINKGSLVNSINERECLVEIDFTIGRTKYRVVRGIKPNVFEIYKNEELINQDAKSLDYQKVLEDQILKFNLKAFCQIVTLGAASFTPFMQLGSSDRRTIIEEILGIEIFSYMSNALKERMKAVRDATKDVGYKKTLAEEKKIMKQKYIDDTTKSNKGIIDEYQKQIDSLKVENDLALKITLAGILHNISTQEQELADNLPLLDGEEEISTKITTANDAINKLEKKVVELKGKCESDVIKAKSEIEKGLSAEKHKLRDEANKKISDLTRTSDLKVSELKSQKSQREVTIKKLDERIKFYETTDVCKICEQPLSEAVKTSEVTKALNEKNEILKELETIKADIADTEVNKLKETKEIKESLDLAISELGDGSFSIQSKTEEIQSSYVSLIATANESVSKFTEAREKLFEKRDSYLPARKKIEGIRSAIASFKSDEKVLRNTVAKNEQSIEKLEDQIKALSVKPKNIDSVLTEMEQLKTDIIGFEKELDGLSVERSYGEIAEDLLKDGGIKAQIIKQYLPVINQSINDYLQKMDFYVSFNLDENFNETILSRGRDSFSYCNFSEGEKQRINIAILFTWRMIAKMKNSMSTNLLIMDEIFDSYLDPEATDNALKLLDTEAFNGSNVIIISHKNSIGDKFNRVGNFRKQGNYSMVEFT